MQLNARLEKSLGEMHLYSRLLDYVWGHKDTAKTVELQTHQSVVLFVGELILSLLCLYVAVNLLLDIKPPSARAYAWLLVIWQACSFFQLLAFRIGWIILDFLVIRLRPDLGQIILRNYPLVLISAAILLYIWLLARTFSLDFWGALKLGLAAHAVYGIAIFMIITAANFLNALTVEAVIKENWGLEQLVSHYLQDQVNITQNGSLFSLFRMKTYHL